MNKQSIKHMVIFTLKHDKGSNEETKFMDDAKNILSSIQVVKDFKIFKQVSQKNDYDYGFSMIFSDQKDYDKYNNHPDHVSFVKNRWEKEVEDFLEIDFTNYSSI